MKLLHWLLAIASGLLLVFAAANWTLVTAPASLNLVFFSVEGPLGAILLIAAFVLVGIVVVYMLSLRTAMLVETRRQAKELAAQRALAHTAEASRFTELQRRIDALERTVLEALTETGNSMSAYVGEVDEKIDRLSEASAR